MTQDILQGKYPLFFYGEMYIGPVESFFSVPFFFLVQSNTLMLRISMLLMAMISFMMFFLGLRLMIREQNNLIALGWLVISPTFLCVYSIVPSGHMGGLFCGGLIFYFSARIISAQKLFWMDFLLYGLVVGFGLWMHPGTLIYVISSGIIVLLNNPRSIVEVPFFLFGLFCGRISFLDYILA